MFKDLEKGRAYRAKWAKEHKVQVNKNLRDWRGENKDRHSETTRLQRLEVKREVLTYYGDDKCECVLCEFKNITALSLDHINGGGNRERREHKEKTGGMLGGWVLYYKLRKEGYPSGYRTLCFNCQMIERDRLQMDGRHEKRS